MAHVDDPRASRTTGIARRRPVVEDLHVAEALGIQRGGIVRKVVVDEAAQLLAPGLVMRTNDVSALLVLEKRVLQHLVV